MTSSLKLAFPARERYSRCVDKEESKSQRRVVQSILGQRERSRCLTTAVSSNSGVRDNIEIMSSLLKLGFWDNDRDSRVGMKSRSFLYFKLGFSLRSRCRRLGGRRGMVQMSVPRKVRDCNFSRQRKSAGVGRRPSCPCCRERLSRLGRNSSIVSNLEVERGG